MHVNIILDTASKLLLSNPKPFFFSQNFRKELIIHIFFKRLFIGLFTSFGMSSKVSMKTYLLNHDKGFSRHENPKKILFLVLSDQTVNYNLHCILEYIVTKIENDPWSDSGMQHRFEFENEIIKRMKELMTDCYSKKPENYCLKLLFDSSFFWEWNK